jgi:hypothetical protein
MTAQGVADCAHCGTARTMPAQQNVSFCDADDPAGIALLTRNRSPGTANEDRMP